MLFHQPKPSLKMNRILLLSLTLLLHSAVFAQWEITSGPTEPNVVTLATNDVLMVASCSSVSSTPGGYITLDNGSNWSQTGITLPLEFSALAIDPVDGTIYAGASGSFFQSFDAGETYTNTNNGLPIYTVRDILIDGDNLYVSNQGIYLSTNEGFNWNLISPVMSSNKMDKIGSQILVGTFTAGVYYSNNNGNSWSNFTEGLPSAIIDVKIVGSNFLVATNFGVYISNDTGITWTLTDQTEQSSCLYQIGNTVFSGADNGVHISSDGGQTWVPENDGLSNLTVYSLAANGTYLFAGTTGYVFRRPLSDLGIVVSEENVQEKEITLYPNPTTGILTIAHPQWNMTQIAVQNLLGQIVLQKSIQNTESTIDLTKSKKGLYIVKITGPNNEVALRKIVIQ
jgi:photosystem II stability/assembly factor-like uncharacterized protein